MIATQPSTTDATSASTVSADDSERQEPVSKRSPRSHTPALKILLLVCAFLLSGCQAELHENRFAPTVDDSADFEELVATANESLAQSNYRDAAKTLALAIRVAEQDASHTDSLELLRAKQTRLSSLGQFLELSEFGQELNFLARESESMSVLLESLDAVGVWKSNQWWDALPAEDLDPIQVDALKWDVYRTLLTLDGLLVRRMGSALGGMSDSGMAITFSMVRRYVMTDAGVNESKAAIEVGRWIDSFQPSQATRWYTATSNFRLRQGQRVKASDLGPPENAADGYSLSILCLIAHMDPTFTTWFSGYGSHLRDGDSTPPSNLETLLQTIRTASEQAPSHYWSHLALGHAFYWMGTEDIARENQRTAIENFQSARKAFQRCIELRPNAPFAYCDRSSVSRREATLIRTLPGATSIELDQANQLMQSSLDDARTGRSLAAESDWVHWHEGLALAATGNHEAAVECFLTAAQFGMDFDASADSLLMRVIDLRGRTEAIDWAEQMAATVENPAMYLSLLSMLHFSRGQLETAKRYAVDTLDHNPTDAIAHAVIGWIELRAGQLDEAKVSLNTAMLGTPSSTWAMLGLAQVELESGNDADAIQLNEQALRLSESRRHQVAACFAAARAYWRQFNDARALECIHRAREIDSACDLNLVIRDAVSDYRASHARLENATQERDQLQSHTEAMKQLLVELSKFPIASPKRILERLPSEPMKNQSSRRD